MRPVRHPLLTHPHRPSRRQELPPRTLPHIICIHRPRVRSIVSQWQPRRIRRRVDGAVLRARVRDIHGLLIRAQANTIPLHETVLDYVDLAPGRPEAVDCRRQASGVGRDVLLPAIKCVYKEDISPRVNYQVVGRVEEGSVIVVQDYGDLVRFGVQGNDPRFFKYPAGKRLAPANGPVDEAFVVPAAVYARDGGRGGVLLQGRWLCSEADEELRRHAVRKG